MHRTILIMMLTFALAGCIEGVKPTPRQRDVAEEKPPARSLYERLGGEKGITKVVDDFVAIVVADPDYRPALKEHFQKGDVAGLKKKLVDQIGEATGGPQKYKGKNMKDAHKGLGITNKDFDALAADLVKALDRNKVGKAEKDELLGMLGKMRGDVVEKPE
ncbi:MAG TPA: group 1 truncated hemoglobin [Gemmataceae bacterium]|nr:group 1 truncated hemoglobin [Gemmataceae bacterium]